MATSVSQVHEVSTAQIARYVAVGASAAAALLYVLIGFQVVSIGQSASSGTPDLLGFGLMTGAFFAALALILLFAQGRMVWIPLAIADLAVIVGYFAMASLRDPNFEVWGLTVKSAQLVMFGALAYLIYHGPIGAHGR